MCEKGVIKQYNSAESPPKLLLPEAEPEVVHKVVHSDIEWTVLLPIL